MLRLVLLAAAATFALGAVSAAGTDKPHRIMSINECTDALLLDLVPPDRIASISFISRTASNARTWPQVARIPINHAAAEEVLAARPDLVLANAFSASAVRALLKRTGTRELDVAPADNFDQIRAATRAVARAVGEKVRGEALLARMDATLARLAATVPRRTIRVAGWDASGAVPGRGTLFDAILTAAGGTNIASSTTGENSGSFDLEQLATARPDILAYGSDNADTPSLRTDNDQHPLLLRLFAGRRVVYPDALYDCGVPQSADAAVALRTSMLAAMRSAPR